MDRRWVYGGLGVAAGIGRAERLGRRRPRLAPGTRLMLLGGRFAEGLAPPLRALARDQRVGFDVVLPPHGPKPPRTEELAARPELVSRLLTFKPTLVAVALDVAAPDMVGKARQAAALKALLGAIGRTGAESVWIGPPSVLSGVRARGEPSRRYFPTATALTLPRGPDGLQPTVAGYAGWAGAIWQWLS